MRLMFHGHACISLEKDGRTLTIDPGSYSDLSGLDRADAVLVTHGHRDHVDVERLARGVAGGSGPAVWAPPDVVAQLQAVLTEGDPDGAGAARVHAVGPGDRVDAVGFDLELFGGEHAVVHPDVPLPPHVSCLVDGRIMHPGDSFAPLPPGRSAEVLLLPVAGPWLRLAEAVDLARQVGADIVVPIHDATLNDAGHATVDRIVSGLVAARYVRVAVGGELIR